MDVPHDSLDACSPAESPGVASMAAGAGADPWSEFKEDATPPSSGGKKAKIEDKENN